MKLNWFSVTSTLFRNDVFPEDENCYMTVVESFLFGDSISFASQALINFS